MFTNSEIIQSIMKSKGISVYDVHVKLNYMGCVYESFKQNRFTKQFIAKLSEIVGEDLSMFINC